MAFEAVDQGARLTQEDFVRLLGVDVRTIRQMIKDFRQEGYTSRPVATVRI